MCGAPLGLGRAQDSFLHVLCTINYVPDPKKVSLQEKRKKCMKVATFALERWMSRWETEVEFDIAESGVYPLTTRELLDFLPEDERAG